MILLSAVLLLAAAVACWGEAIPTGIVVLNHTMLQTWYDPVQLCMMEDRSHLDNASYWAYLSDCETVLSVNNSKPTHQFASGFATLPSSAYSRKSRDGCCNSDVQIRDRGFDWALEGHEDGSVQHAISVMMLLSQRNMSILFMGDSMNNQVFTAFIEECKREGIRGNFDAGVRGTFSWFNRPEEHGLSRKTLGYVGAVVRFDWSATPTGDTGTGSGSSRNPVYIYAIDLWYGRRAVANERLVMEMLIPIISTSHPSGLAVLSNIGHHLEAERSHNNKASMVHTVGGFIDWMHELTKLNQGLNFVAFRETTPSHFDSPEADGSFEKWRAAGRSNYDYMKSNSWDGTHYHCHSINSSSSWSSTEVASDTDPRTKNTLENLVVRDILSAWRDTAGVKNTSPVQVLHVFRYLAPFYRLKYGFCGGYDRIPVLDCVHYCAWGPTMWVPIWDELHSLLRNWSLSLLPSKSKAEAEAAGADQQTVYKPTFGKMILEEVLILNSSIALESYHLFYHGVRHVSLNMHCIEEELGVLSNSTTFPVVKTITKEQLDRIPLGLPVTEYPEILDGAALQQHGDGQVWYFKNSTRHAIPNWDTFCSLGFGRASIIHLSDNVMDRIPVGDSVAPRDWPKSC